MVLITCRKKSLWQISVIYAKHRKWKSANKEWFVSIHSTLTLSTLTIFVVSEKLCHTSLNWQKEFLIVLHSSFNYNSVCWLDACLYQNGQWSHSVRFVYMPNRMFFWHFSSVYEWQMNFWEWSLQDSSLWLSQLTCTLKDAASKELHYCFLCFILCSNFLATCFFILQI